MPRVSDADPDAGIAIVDYSTRQRRLGGEKCTALLMMEI
jgi:hypothetical protein